MENKGVTLSAGFCLMLALMLLLMPLRWLIAAIVAALLHELCHYIAIRLLCGSSANIRFYSFGARMPLPEMTQGRELVCALAGPAGGLWLTLLSPIFPRLAVCGFIQSAYNLLPLYPMDGGRAVSCLLSIFLSPVKAATMLRWIGIFTRTFILLGGCYCCFVLELGYLPLLLCLLICIRTK